MDNAPTTERRHEPRRRALKNGRIVFKGHSSTLNCTVRNLSSHGALLQVAGPFGIPDAFDLEVEPGGVLHPCHVVWRKERQLGVIFPSLEAAE